MPLLSDAEVETALAALPGWTRSGAEIEKTYECASFPDAVAPDETQALGTAMGVWVGLIETP